MDSLKRPPEIEDLSDEIKEVCALKEGYIRPKIRRSGRNQRQRKKVAGQTGTGFGKLEKDAR